MSFITNNRLLSRRSLCVYFYQNNLKIWLHSTLTVERKMESFHTENDVINSVSE